MILEELIKHQEEVAEEHRELAEWLKEMRVFKSRKGQWIRMSDLSEQEDDRYKCSRCGNVIHHKNKMDLYTFNSWCGRCGSDNGRKNEIVEGTCKSCKHQYLSLQDEPCKSCKNTKWEPKEVKE